MVEHLASPKPLHMARWGGKGALMGCTRRTTGPTETLSLPTEDQTHTHLKMNYLMFLLELGMFLGRSHGKTPAVRILSHIKSSNASMQTAAQR